MFNYGFLSSSKMSNIPPRVLHVPHYTAPHPRPRLLAPELRHTSGDPFRPSGREEGVTKEGLPLRRTPTRTTLVPPGNKTRTGSGETEVPPQLLRDVPEEFVSHLYVHHDVPVALAPGDDDPDRIPTSPALLPPHHRPTRPGPLPSPAWRTS